MAATTTTILHNLLKMLLPLRLQFSVAIAIALHELHDMPTRHCYIIARIYWFIHQMVDVKTIK